MVLIVTVVAMILVAAATILLNRLTRLRTSRAGQILGQQGHVQGGAGLG
jgi:hypothetical protein